MLAIAVFGGAAIAILYICILYPLWLRYAASRWARPVLRSPSLPGISIVIAVHNGEKYLAEKLLSVLQLDYPATQMEVIVASDGSTDGTDAIARKFSAEGVRLLSLPRGGKPAAINAAIPATHGEIVILTDVRQSLASDSVRLLVESFADPSVGAVSGELIIRAGATDEEADIGLYWRFESWIRGRLSALDSMFGATGPFYAIRRDLVEPIPADMLLDDMFLPLAAYFRGFRLINDPRARAYDVPTTLETEFRRKVRTLAGNYQILRAYPALLGPGNRMWLHFVSYKFGRLLLPWFLIALAISSFGLPEPWRSISLAGQAGFYALAALDAIIPARIPLKRISSPARTFVTMMIAAICGLSVFFVPPRSLWKVTSAGAGGPG